MTGLSRSAVYALMPSRGSPKPLPARATLDGVRAHAPCIANGEPSVGEGMISSESRMREICTSGSMSGDWKRSQGGE